MVQREMSRRPLIAIVGRPNVGKSTLFNRLCHRRRAIVEDTPGVTRDRHYADVEFDGRPVTLVDTGGFVPDEKHGDPLSSEVRLQAQAAVEEADMVLLVMDGRAGITSGDHEVAIYLRKQKTPLILVVNKVDAPRDADTLLAEFYGLGLGEPVAVSAEHARGMSELHDRIDVHLPPLPPEVEAPEGEAGKGDGKLPDSPPVERPIRIAVVGRPNVGKSTLVNALLKKERVIVSPIAGTTRDPIDTPLQWKGRDFVLTDTAGIRRKAAITQKVEGFSVMGALRAVEDNDVTVLVLDATEAGVEQDRHIASLAEQKGRALIIVVNKWDLAREKWKEEDFRTSLKWYLDWVGWAPMLFITAKTGHRVEKILEVALELYQQQYTKASTPLLNRILDHVTTEHSTPIIKGRQLKLYYCAQVAVAPPAFAFMCSQAEGIPDRYQRYVSNYLRSTLRLKVPIRLFWRKRPGQRQRTEAVQRFKARAKHQKKR